MKKYFKNLWMLLFLVMITAMNGQNNDGQSHMTKLNFLEGAWNISNYSLEGDNKWKLLGPTKGETKTLYDGKFISESSRYLTSFGQINMITTIGYDSRLGHYKLSAMDKEYGLMDIYFGKWKEEKLVFTNLESDLPIKIDDGREMFFRLTYTDIGENTFTHLVEGTFDKGKTWFTFSKSIYKTDSN